MKARFIIETPDIPFEVRRLTVDEYHRLIDLGFFAPRERVELMDGLMLVPSRTDQDTIGDRLRRISLEEYHKLIDCAFFNPAERTELITGVLHTMSPRGSRHSDSLSLLLRVLNALVSAHALIRVQDPITLPLSTSEPEPDLVLVELRPGGYPDRHPEPRELLLLVEVADSTLKYDRDVKGPLYAAAGIAEYWLVNLLDTQLEVYRDPVMLPDGKAGYRTRLTYWPGDSVAPLAFAASSFLVDEIIPGYGLGGYTSKLDNH